ncbi:MAG: acyl-CoA dehydrogenase [Actinomycetia bacterium]|nr:acyl-CoA dehydrogenase [Actinomycetes bacterium]
METYDSGEAIKRAGKLAPLLAAEAADAETSRTVTPTVMEAVEESGLFGIVSPTRWGGMGLDLRTLGEVTRTLARGCPATAWTVSFLMLHNWFVTRFPEPAQAALFADRPFTFIPAPLAPTGKLTRTDGGYRLKGSWDWATGVNHGEWVMVHAVDEASLAEGGFATRFAMLPIDSVTVEDVWFTSGMRATGSNRVVVDGLDVAGEFTIPGDRMLDCGIGDDPMDTLPLMAVLGLVASASALGAAEAAVEIFSARMRERVLAYTLRDRQADQPAARVRLSAATAEVRSAAAYWRSTVDELEVAASSAQGATIDHRGAARLASAAVVASSRSAISTVCEGSGASVYSESSPLQRIQRDVEVLKGHVVFDWDRSAELAGRIMLGMELGPVDMV